jgi:hypothetical protein
VSLHKPGFLANRNQVLKCSLVFPDAMTRSVLWSSTHICSVRTLSNHTTATFPRDAAQAATKHNFMSFTQDMFKSCDWIICQDQMHKTKLYDNAYYYGSIFQPQFIFTQVASLRQFSFSSISKKWKWRYISTEWRPSTCSRYIKILVLCKG